MTFSKKTSEITVILFYTLKFKTHNLNLNNSRVHILNVKNFWWRTFCRKIAVNSIQRILVVAFQFKSATGEIEFICATYLMLTKMRISDFDFQKFERRIVRIRRWLEFARHFSSTPYLIRILRLQRGKNETISFSLSAPCLSLLNISMWT